MTRRGRESVVFRGRLFEVVHEEVQHVSGLKTFEFARRAPGTRIILVGEPRQLLLTREYRHEINGYDVRLPGGKVFDSLEEYEVARSSGRSIEELAKDAAGRELREETGYEAKDLTLLHISRCGATVEWDLYYFLCDRWVAPTTPVTPLEDEDITLQWTSEEDAVAMALDGRISEERSAIAILRQVRLRHT